MRCQKCGFIGFDHLSECSVCGDDLSSIRENLGFLRSKPTAPCFLGALLKDYEVAAPHQEIGEPRVNPVISSIPGIEFGDDFQLSGVSPEFDPGDVPTVQVSSPTIAPSPFEGALMIDLSDDDLDPSKDGEVPGEIELDLDFLLDGEAEAAEGGLTAFGSADKKNGNSAGAAVDTPMNEHDSAALELTDEDLNEITSESDPDIEIKGSAAGAPAQDFGNMVLDLSDDDLQNLISDLE